jgi:hypothetical protein
MALAAGMAAVLFPPLREAIGIDRPDAGQLDKTQQLFGDALAGQGHARLALRAGELGFTAAAQSQAWQGVMISDGGRDCANRGSYLFRDPPDASPIAITAPHRGSDRNTGTIAASLFLESSAAAAAWNSAPRNPGPDCAHAIDLARQPDHPFTAFALAFANTYPDGTIIQLHGFERMKRASGAASGADMILSNGTREPTPRLLDLADCLSRNLAPHQALVFPYETGELGALSNAQAIALGEVGFDGFVHLELSAEFRQKLAEEKDLRNRLSHCLEGAAR